MSRNSNTIGGKRKRNIRADLRGRYGDNCHWCGKPMCFDTKEELNSATIEHLKPRSEGGTNERSNLRLAHKRCNEDRSDPKRRCFSPFYGLAEL